MVSIVSAAAVRQAYTTATEQGHTGGDSAPKFGSCRLHCSYIPNGTCQYKTTSLVGLYQDHFESCCIKEAWPPILFTKWKFITMLLTFSAHHN